MVETPASLATSEMVVLGASELLTDPNGAKVSGMVATTDPLVDHLIALFKRAASNPTFRSERTM
jgi:hypothetical protein